MPKTPVFNGYIGITEQDSASSYVQPSQPARRPNIVYVVLDDVGFAQIGCFGSTIHTPNIDALAAGGLRFRDFHTTAICSATRASLLTGANHHEVGVSTVVDTLNGDYPNRQGHIDPHYATTAEVLHEYGYANYCVGKWHLAPFSECTNAGPFDNWPLQKGFDRYYGFLEGFTDEWHPDLVQDNERLGVERTQRPGYHLSEDLADKAIEYLFRHHAARPDDPFFLYFAPGACHAPHQAPKEYIDHYRGAFDEGWDKVRAQWLERQKEFGIVPKDTELSERNEFVQPWDSLSADERRVFARYMEVFAGYLEHADAQIGRVLDYVHSISDPENTLIVLLSDNGASAEGGQYGRYDQEKGLSLVQPNPENVALTLPHLDELGDEYTNVHYPVGWANAGNTPFKWYKSFAYAGGVNDPLIVSYPAEIRDPGAVRTQYAHVSDIAPTVLDILGVRKPEQVKGVPQRPYTGTSLRYAFANPQAPTRKRVQYFEQAGSRGIWHDSWKAIAWHDFGGDYLEDEWELYDTEHDFSETHDLAAEQPEKLEELKALWWAEAGRHDVLPLSHGPYLLATSRQLGMAFGPGTSAAQFYLKPQRFEYSDVIHPIELSAKTVFAARSHRLEASFEYQPGDEGIIYAGGSRVGGYVLYVRGGELRYGYNANKEHYYAIASDALAPGKVEAKLDFRVTEEGSATATLSVNGHATGSIEITQFPFLMESHASVKDGMTSEVVDDYRLPFEYPRPLGHVLIEAAALGIGPAELDRFFEAD